MFGSVVRHFRIESKDLVYLKFILEAYEGLVTLSTEDAKNNIIRISTPNGLTEEVEKLLQELHAEVSFHEIPPVSQQGM